MTEEHLIALMSAIVYAGMYSNSDYDLTLKGAVGEARYLLREVRGQNE